MMCARCRQRLDEYRDCIGESGLYSPHRGFDLCEPCFDAEDAEIDARGSNEWPERIAEYKQNLRAGPLRHGVALSSQTRGTPDV